MTVTGVIRDNYWSDVIIDVTETGVRCDLQGHRKREGLTLPDDDAWNVNKPQLLSSKMIVDLDGRL